MTKMFTLLPRDWKIFFFFDLIYFHGNLYLLIADFLRLSRFHLSQFAIELPSLQVESWRYLNLLRHSHLSYICIIDCSVCKHHSSMDIDSAYHNGAHDMTCVDMSMYARPLATL